MSAGKQVVRGYFGLGDHEASVSVTSDDDFLLYVTARNVEIFDGGVQISTGPSQFRGSGSTGPSDALGLDVGAQSGVALGCIGASGGEAIELTNSHGARVTVFLTVVTTRHATVEMNATPVGT